MKTLYLSILLLLTLSCSKSNDETTFTPQTITPVLIGKGSLFYNFYDRQNMVITNNSDWQTLLTNFNSVNDGITSTFSETNIDFNNFEIIIAIDVKNSSTTIDITNVIENENNITVTVQNLILGISGDVANPFHIVKIPKSNKPVVFQ
jgi:hypothetical protein